MLYRVTAPWSHPCGSWVSRVRSGCQSARGKARAELADARVRRSDACISIATGYGWGDGGVTHWDRIARGRVIKYNGERRPENILIHDMYAQCHAPGRPRYSVLETFHVIIPEQTFPGLLRSASDRTY